MSNEPLACGHPDTTPEEWHNDEYGEQVCADCCYTCRLFDDQGQGPAKRGRRIVNVLTALILLNCIAWFAVGYFTAQPDKPDCPTEDSCTVDYHNGEWHIEEASP